MGGPFARPERTTGELGTVPAVERLACLKQADPEQRTARQYEWRTHRPRSFERISGRLLDGDGDEGAGLSGD